MYRVSFYGIITCIQGTFQHVLFTNFNIPWNLIYCLAFQLIHNAWSATLFCKLSGIGLLTFVRAYLAAPEM